MSNVTTDGERIIINNSNGMDHVVDENIINTMSDLHVLI